MDKYELNIKLEQVRKLIRKKDYSTAAKIIDTLDWYKIKSNETLLMFAEVYEASGQIDKTKEILLEAYSRTSLGRQLS